LVGGTGKKRIPEPEKCQHAGKKAEQQANKTAN